MYGHETEKVKSKLSGKKLIRKQSILIIIIIIIIYVIIIITL